MAGVSFSPAFCLCHWSRYNRHCHWSLSLEPVLFRPHSHFYSLPQLLMQVGLWATTWALRGQLWVPTGLCRGDVPLGTGVQGGATGTHGPATKAALQRVQHPLCSTHNIHCCTYDFTTQFAGDHLKQPMVHRSAGKGSVLQAGPCGSCGVAWGTSFRADAT